jgi:hypothetical protein
MDKQKKDELLKKRHEAYQRKKSQLAGTTQDAHQHSLNLACPSLMVPFTIMYITCWFNVVSATNHLLLDFFT